MCCGVTGALAWNADVLSSGSRDRLILQKDIRTPSLVPERKLTGHRQEVGWVTSQCLLDQDSISYHYIVTVAAYVVCAVGYKLRSCSIDDCASNCNFGCVLFAMKSK